MGEQRVSVWVQEFQDRPNLMLQWNDPATGKRKSKSAGTVNPAVAEQKRADLEYELNHGLRREPSSIDWITFRDLFEHEYLSGRRPGTRDRYGDCFEALERICDPARLSHIDERMLSKFVAALRTDRTRYGVGQKPNTIAVKLSYLKAALRWGKDQKLIVEVPKFPAIKVPKKYPQPVPPETVEKLLVKADDPQLRTYLLTAWLAGLRLNEALQLERDPSDAAPWVDWKRNRIVLPAEFVKGDADQWVPLDPELRAALEALPRKGPKLFCFTDAAGQPVTASAVEQRIARVAKAAGVRLTMRALRRGFACRYAGKVPAQVLQRLMRHAEIKTTLGYYVNLDAAVEAAVLGSATSAA